MNPDRERPHVAKPQFAASVALAVSVGLLAVSCEPSAELPAGGRAVASIGGEPVSAAEFRHWWNRVSRAADTPELRREALGELVARRKLVGRAREAGLDRDPAVVEAYHSLLIARLQEAELEPALAAVKVTDGELRAEYRLVAATRFSTGPRARVAVLWFDSRGHGPLAERYGLRLREVREKLAGLPAPPAPADGFGPLAQTESEHRVSRFRGGDIGWVDLGAPDLDPWRAAVAEIASGLHSPGETSAVVVRDEGVFLVRLIESRPARTRPFEDVRAVLEREEVARRSNRLRETFLDGSSGAPRGSVTIDDAALAAVAGLETAPSAAGIPPRHPGALPDGFHPGPGSNSPAAVASTPSDR